MRPKPFVAILVSILSFTLAQTSEADPVSSAISLEKLTEEADIVFKVVAIESTPTDDSTLKATPGFKPYSTKLRVVAIYKHLQKQPVAQLRSGRFDEALDAMESPNYYSSSEPRDLYAFYLQRDMKDRAKKFRAACKKRITYDIDYYFNMVDKSPDTYQRN